MMIEILMSPCGKHRNYREDCVDCRGRERELYWQRQRRLAEEEKRA